MSYTSPMDKVNRPTNHAGNSSILNPYDYRPGSALIKMHANRFNRVCSSWLFIEYNKGG